MEAGLARCCCHHTSMQINFQILDAWVHAGSSAALGVQQREREAEQLAELSRLVLRQQNQLGDVLAQVARLQTAVCRLDGTAPGCQRHQPPP